MLTLAPTCSWSAGVSEAPELKLEAVKELLVTSPAWDKSASIDVTSSSLETSRSEDELGGSLAGPAPASASKPSIQRSSSSFPQYTNCGSESSSGQMAPIHRHRLPYAQPG